MTTLEILTSTNEIMTQAILASTNEIDLTTELVNAINASTTGTNAATAATEIGKVPRAATAMAGGDDFALNAVTDTVNKLTVNYTKEEV